MGTVLIILKSFDHTIVDILGLEKLFESVNSQIRFGLKK